MATSLVYKTPPSHPIRQVLSVDHSLTAIFTVRSSEKQLPYVSSETGLCGLTEKDVQFNLLCYSTPQHWLLCFSFYLAESETETMMF